jgi:hypothetical protein
MSNRRSAEATSIHIECVLLLQNVFSYYRMCSLTAKWATDGVPKLQARRDRRAPGVPYMYALYACPDVYALHACLIVPPFLPSLHVTCTAYVHAYLDCPYMSLCVLIYPYMSIMVFRIVRIEGIEGTAKPLIGLLTLLGLLACHIYLVFTFICHNTLICPSMSLHVLICHHMSLCRACWLTSVSWSRRAFTLLTYI